MLNCFLSIHKIHDKAHMSWTEKHMRHIDTPKDSVIECATPRQSYWNAIQTRLETFPYYDSHKVRGNAVLAYSVYLSCSNSSEVNRQAWIAASLTWLHDTFDQALDGVSNILEAVYRAAPAPHLHALVIPIDPRGHLCASYFTNGRTALAGLQASYAKQMQYL